MAVLYSHTPSFVFRAMLRAHPEWAELPVALTSRDDGLIWAQSPLASESGVSTGMTPRQARARCPDLRLHDFDTALIDEVQSRFLGVLTGTGLTVESAGIGSAYCDLSPVSVSPADALAVCGDLGAQLRRVLGDDLVPAMGCDHGKFTARAAACVARPGCLRVVEKAQERHFLAPLPITLLPLPLPSLREMNWLGIDTLDALARLPASSVLQRWGKPGVTAQRLAQGRDERPVVSTQSALPAPVDVDFETLCENVEQATADVLRAFAATVARVAERLCGCQGLQLTLGFLDCQTHVHDLVFAAPVYDATSIGKALARAMRSRAWPAPLTSACVAITALNELPSGQLSLFDDDDAWTGQTGDNGAAQRYTDLIDRAGRKYPGAFYGARLAVPSHRAPERRVLWTCLGDER